MTDQLRDDLLAAMDRPQASAVKQSFQPDPCCQGPLSKSLRSGHLDTATEWQCPKCGCPWKVSLISGMRYWLPDPLIQVWRR